MTLYRQLMIFSLLLFFLLFAGTWVAKLNSTRTFLLDQLQSHSQDTATSLGLSVSPHMERNDLPAIETMFNAVFDRGYYRLVRLTDLEGKVLIDRTLTVKNIGVPEWFVDLVRLETPRATAMVMAGWRQAGQVVVESHPGYAYRTLWESVVQTLTWFLIMGILVLVGGGFALRLLLEPLKRVERQAGMLCRRQYEIQEHLPRTIELRNVVEAMNRMTYKVREMFEEQSRTAELLRKNAYVDTVTGLGNRRYLEGQVTMRLERDGKEAKGAFLLIQMHDLDEINQQKGFEAGDAILQRAAHQLADLSSHWTHAALSRLTGGNFGLFLPNAGIGDVQKIAEDIVREFAQLAVEGFTLSNNVAHVGGVVYTKASEMGQLLSSADTALRAAQQEGINRWQVDLLADASKEGVRGEKRWQDLLAKTLKEKNILLFSQKTVSCAGPGRTLHLELFSKVKDGEATLISGGQFIPFAERLGLVSALDKLVVEKALHAAVSEPLAVNVSPSSLGDEGFRQWVLDALRKLPSAAPRLFFEFAEFGAVANLELLREFGARLHELGHGYGLDHFGQGFANFGYLKSLHPDYVKIDRAFTDELQNRESDSYFFIGSLTGVAHSLDIMVIAEGVETEAQRALLCELNIDAVQGYHIGRLEQINAAD